MGRDRDLATLHELLQAVEHPHLVSIVGMPGVGKTELAIQYGRSHREDYPGGVAYFSAANFGEAVRDWMQAEFCPDRDLRHLTKLEQQVAQGWKEWQDVCGNRLALVIINDVPNDVTSYRQQIEPYLPQAVSDRFPFRFLLTSRSRLVSTVPIPALDLRELDPDAALTMLGRFAGAARIERDRPTAETLCRRLAYLPLAIALVGSWLSVDVDRTLSQLIESLERQGLDAPALERNPKTIQLTAESGLKAAFKVSWAELETLSPSAQQLARVLSLFAATDLPWDLVAGVVQTYAKSSFPGIASKEAPGRRQTAGWAARLQQAWEWLVAQVSRWLGRRSAARPVPTSRVPIADPLEARGTLLRMSLLSRVNQDATGDPATGDLVRGDLVRGDRPLLYHLHPLLREFFAEQWAGADRKGWELALAETIAARAEQVPANLSWEQAAAYHDLLPHLSTAQKILRSRAFNTADPATATRYRTQADAIGSASFRLSRSVLFEVTFDRASKAHNEARIAAAVGNTQLANQRFAEALEDYRQVIAKAREAFPGDNLQLAGYLHKIAELFYELGSYRDGIPPAEEAVRIATAKATPVKLAVYLNRLALLHEHQGNYSEAELLNLKALAIREQYLGKEHPEVALSLNNLAATYDSQGRYDESESLHLRALAIREERLGKNHLDVAFSLNNLATLYTALGHFSKAEPLHLRALAIREQHLGNNHPDVALSLMNLANIYRVQGRYSEAETLYFRSLAIREQRLGNNHPHVAFSLINLGNVYHAQGRYSEAEPLYMRSLAIREQRLGNNHPDVAFSLNNLANTYQAQGRYRESEPLYLRAIAIRCDRLGEAHPDTQSVRQNFANMVTKAVQAGRAGELSDHPTTQALIQQIQQGNEG
ncbi:MAG: hypothetical protein Fur0046_13760 [Cyanobacteria bacterium J069]|nr:MAG: tetratricopeptide repeat protein [Cyanobacteria bacterium J069]